MSSVLSSVLSIVLSSVLSSGAVKGTVSTLFSKGCLLLLTHRQDETSHLMVRKIRVCVRIRESTAK